MIVKIYSDASLASAHAPVPARVGVRLVFSSGSSAKIYQRSRELKLRRKSPLLAELQAIRFALQLLTNEFLPMLRRTSFVELNTDNAPAVALVLSGSAYYVKKGQKFQVQDPLALVLAEEIRFYLEEIEEKLGVKIQLRWIPRRYNRADAIASRR